MNHHLAVKNHTPPCNLEYIEKKHWLIHVPTSEQGPFACSFTVKCPGCWMGSGALWLQIWKFSCWMLRPRGRLTISFLSKQKEKVRQASVMPFGCLQGLGCPSGWSAAWCHPRIWPPHWCCHLQWRHLPAGVWTEGIKQLQLSGTTAPGWLWHKDKSSSPVTDPLRAFPSSMPVREA